jgi:hypothetical protein
MSATHDSAAMVWDNLYVRLGARKAASRLPRTQLRAALIGAGADEHLKC